MAVCKRQRAHAAISRGVINDADQTTEAKAKRATLRQSTSGVVATIEPYPTAFVRAFAEAASDFAAERIFTGGAS